MIDDIRAILDGYLDTRMTYRTPDSNLPVVRSIVRTADQLDQLLRSTALDSLKVRRSWGKGAWTPTPWIAALDSRHTTTTQSWFYPVLLFRADGSGLYLSLSVATGRPFGTPNRTELIQIANRAKRFRSAFGSLGAIGLASDPELDLRVERGVGVGFKYGSIVHKFYDRDTLPSEEDIERDFLMLSTAYYDFCSRADAWDLYYELTLTEAELSGRIDTKGPQIAGQRQGFAVNSATRKAVEKYAVDKAIMHFETEGWKVDPSPQKNRPFDLLCERNGETTHVEVKGTTGTGASVILTHGEVNHALENPERAVLFVVSDIVLQLGSGSDLNLSGGKINSLYPWIINQRDLKPISYEYSVE